MRVLVCLVLAAGCTSGGDGGGGGGAAAGGTADRGPADQGPADRGAADGEAADAALECGSACGPGTHCEAGRCVADPGCTPDCNRRICGTDGCDGSCGDCAADEVCNDAGRCVDAPVECGNGVCGADEDCGICSADCGCRAGQICQAGRCEVDVACGDELCGPAENCQTCAADCGCPGGQACDGGRCVAEARCGDGVCQADETCGACLADCPCAEGARCEQDRCVPLARCGDGVCNAAEDCVDCPEDCSCAAEERCDANRRVCVCAPACTDRVCGDDGCGGSCGMCGARQACADGLCVADCQGACGEAWGQTCTADGFAYQTCVPGAEVPECTEISHRIPCGDGRACANGRCAGDCLSPEVMFLVDHSSSMSAGGRWDFVQEALEDITGQYAAGSRLGIRLFPSAGAPCEPDGIGPLLIDNAVAFTRLPPPTAAAQTPLTAAFGGLEDAFGDPDEGETVVLLTDGDETCADAASLLARVEALRRHGVHTYAIGVSQQANGDLLSAVATAGGTARPGERNFYLARDGAELSAALEDIFARLEACRCSPGDRLCDGDLRLTCAADRQSLEVVEDCEFGCATPDACHPLCRPGTFVCTPGIYQRCVDGNALGPRTGCSWVCTEEGGCPTPAFIDHCELHAPLNLVARNNQAFLPLVRLRHAGMTDRTPGNDLSIELIDVGFGPPGSDPARDAGWRWFDVYPDDEWNADAAGVPDLDQYTARMGGLGVGQYDVAARVSTRGIQDWRYCDRGPAGSDDGYRPQDAGHLQITP